MILQKSLYAAPPMATITLEKIDEPGASGRC